MDWFIYIDSKTDLYLIHLLPERTCFLWNIVRHCVHIHRLKIVQGQLFFTEQMIPGTIPRAKVLLRLSQSSLEVNPFKTLKICDQELCNLMLKCTFFFIFLNGLFSHFYLKNCLVWRDVPVRFNMLKIIIIKNLHRIFH